MAQPNRFRRARFAAEYDHLVKLILVGDEGTGKTSLMRRFCDDEFMFSYMATIGVDFKIRTLQLEPDGVPTTVKLQMWDTAGQERFNSITKSFYRGADILVVVYDVTNYNTFANVRKWLTGCTDVCGDSIPVCLVGNKSDLGGHRQVETDVAKAFAAEMGTEESPAVFVETSAKDGSGVDDMFQKMAREFVRRERAANRFTSRARGRAGRGGMVSRARDDTAVDLASQSGGGCWEFFRKLFSGFAKPKAQPRSASGARANATRAMRTAAGVRAVVPAL